MSCLILTQQEGATEAVGFFGCSLHGVADKQALGDFRAEQPRKSYHPIQLNVISSRLPPYGCCAESIPLESNLVLWVPLFALVPKGKLADSHRQESKLNFSSQVNGFANDNYGAKIMTGLNWSEFCSALPYKTPCKHCVKHVEVAGRDPSSFCFFPNTLVAQTISSRASQATIAFPKKSSTPLMGVEAEPV